MSNELLSPLWLASDLGRPVPGTLHAVSVALPLWSQVIGYEEGDPEVTGKFQSGYPRFFLHPLVTQLFQEAERRFAREDERAIVFPNPRVAQRAADFMLRHGNCVPTQRPFAEGEGKGGEEELTVLVFPERAWDSARRYWRICGEIVSSRRAAAALDLEPDPEAGDTAEAGREALLTLRERLAEWSGQPDHHIFIYPSGMAAIAAVQRVLTKRRPESATVQLDFPYVDVLKIQQECGPGVLSLSDGETPVTEQLAAQLTHQSYAGVYTEVPSNPLLRCVDVPAISALLRANKIPFVIDDTIATVHNVDLFPYVDIVTSSLTKFVSGSGDVMAGCAIVSRDSPLAEELLAALAAESDVPLWREDVIALEKNSRDFPARMARINATALELCQWLRSQPEVAAVYYPAITSAENYQALVREGGGYGGLFSFVLKDGAARAPRVYDHLRVTKGPSLGTNFTLACPYTLLAHYDELDWAAKCGVDANLIRVSVGLEEPADLIARFQEALQS